MYRCRALIGLMFCILLGAAQPSLVKGRVLGPTGKALVGAVVALVPVGGGDPLTTTPEQRTQADGAFALKAAEGRYGLTVMAQGCLPHFRNLDLKAGEALKPLEIRLEKGGVRIQGSLLTSPGLPLGKARCAFSKVSDDKGDQFYAWVEGRNFDIYLAPGTYVAVAEGKGQRGFQRFEVNQPVRNAFVQLRALPTPAPTQVQNWARRTAMPLAGVEAGQGFADLQPLKAVIGDATVVGLGEATHGTREFFQLKHRMLEFLATEMGFTVFAIEANLPEAFAVNAYVLDGKGDPAKALEGLYFWTWNTEEVLALIQWMRAYNLDPAHVRKLKFYGVDMQTDVVALAQAKAWLKTVDPAEAERLEAWELRKSKLSPKWGAKPGAPEQQAWLALSQEMDAMIGRLEARTDGSESFDRQRQNLRVLAQYSRMQGDAGYGVRDVAMAENLRWIQSREGGAKVVLWAHNGHISRKSGVMAGADPMGLHLRESLGSAYLPIGFAFQEGAFQAMTGGRLTVSEVKAQPEATLDALLAECGHAALALDLRKRPPSTPISRWLEAPQGTWSIGALFTPGMTRNFIAQEAITEAYDALLFVGKTTAARPVGGRPPALKAAEAKAPVNLDFAAGMAGWSKPKTEGFELSLVQPGPKLQAQALRIASTPGAGEGAWTTSMQAFDATAYRGKKVRLSGWIRTGGEGNAKGMLWLRVDCSRTQGFFDNMMRRPVTGSEWTEAVIEGPVAEDAVNLNFGCMMLGQGSASFGGLRFEVLP